MEFGVWGQAVKLNATDRAVKGGTGQQAGARHFVPGMLIGFRKANMLILVVRSLFNCIKA